MIRLPYFPHHQCNNPLEKHNTHIYSTFSEVRVIKLILRKLVVIIIAIPILHWIGIQYARSHPRFGGVSFRRSNVDTERTYWEYAQSALNGDFGSVNNVDIVELLYQPFWNSLVLIGFAIMVTAVLGILLGFLSVSRHTMRIRPVGLLLTTAGSSIPGFLLGGVVIALIVYQTLYGGLKQTPLPMSGYGINEHLILPLLVLAVRPTLHLAKVTAGLLENEMQKDYIRTARSKGAKWRRIYWSHAFSNIIAPIIVVLGQSMRFIVGGLLIVEMMFLWPGVGRFFVYAIAANENLQGQFQYFAHPELIAALSIIMGVLLLTADLIASVSTYVTDPRLREVL